MTAESIAIDNPTARIVRITVARSVNKDGVVAAHRVNHRHGDDHEVPQARSVRHG